MKICIVCHQRFESVEWGCPNCGHTPPVRSGFFSFLEDNLYRHESFDRNYFPGLYQLEKDNFWFIYRNRLILRAIGNNFPEVRLVMEIGCGTGFVLSEIRRRHQQFKLCGSDLYLEGLQFASARVPDADFYQIDACKMPFIEEFDLILALDILEHIEDDDKALEEIYKSLVPGGGLIITVPQHQWLWSKQDEKAFHRRRYGKKELMQKLMDSGFRIVHMTSFITLLLPLMIFSRLYAQLAVSKQKEYDPLRELRIASSINRILSQVCGVEGRMLERGKSLPIGGSLICIARKGS